jgi:Fe-Mn family superoxide dismutase
MQRNDSERTDGLEVPTRRNVLQVLGIAAGATAAGGGLAAGGGMDGAGNDRTSDGDIGDEDAVTTESGMPRYALPPLPYDYDALEPSIDAEIMRLHHDEHHQGYVDGANAALDELEEMREQREFSDIKSVKRDLSFNLSGHVLHTLFWENMGPDGGGDPPADLAEVLTTHFGSVATFKAEFSAAATNVEDSGWGLLVYDHLADMPIVIQAEDHNDLAIQGSTPLLALDVWEHAYYLQYKNDRGEYVENWWDVVNWEDVARRYEVARSA